MAPIRLLARALGARPVAAAVAGAVIVAVVASLPGQWGVAHGQTAGPTPTPVPEPTPVTVLVSPQAGAVVSVPNAGNAELTVVIPPGSEVVAFTFEPVGAALIVGGAVVPPPLPPGVPPPPPPSGSGSVTVISLFRLDVVMAAGEEEPLDQPATIDVDVPPEVFALIGGDLSRLSLERFDEASGTWQPAACVPSGAGLACTTTVFSLWALVVLGQPAPVQATPSPGETGDGPAEEEDEATRERRGASGIVAAFGVLVAGVAASALATWRREPEDDAELPRLG